MSPFQEKFTVAFLYPLSSKNMKAENNRLTSGGIPSAAASEKVKAGASDGHRGSTSEGRKAYVQYCHSGSNGFKMVV